jgi:tol-pal system protein YbgF
MGRSLPSLAVTLFVLGLSAQALGQGIAEEQDYAFGYGLYKDGMYQLAYQELANFVEKYPNSLRSAEASFLIAECAFRLGKYTEASQRYDAFIRNYPNSSLRPDAVFRRGETGFRGRQYDKAIRYFKQVIDEYPQSQLAGEAAYWIGESYIKEENPTLAIRYYTLSYETYPANRLADYALYSAGWAYEKKGEYSSALACYRKLVDEFKSSGLLSTCLARIGASYIGLRQYQKAIDELTSSLPSVRDTTERGEAIYLLGESYYNLGNYVSAEQQYKALQSDFPNHKLVRDATYSLGWTYLKQNQFRKAAETFGEVAEGGGELAHAAAFRRALALKFAGDKLAAKAALQSILLSQKGGAYADNAAYELGVLNYDGKEYQTARKDFLLVIESYLQSDVRAEAFRMLGETNLALGDFAEAQKAFHSAVAAPDVSPEVLAHALFQEGWSLYKLKQYEEALGRFGAFVRRFPQDAKTTEATFWMAEASYHLGKYVEARETYGKVIASQPRHEKYEDALYGQAWSSYKLGEFARSAREFERLLTLSPKGKFDFDARVRLADCYYAQKDFGRAAKAYENAITRYPKHEQLDYSNYQLGQALFKSGNWQQALETFRRLISAFPSSDLADDAQYGIGWTYFSRKDYTSSIIEFQKLISKYPTSDLAPRAYYSIGDANYNLLQYDAAIASYQQVLTKYPTSPLVSDAITGIQYCLSAQGKHEESLKVIDAFIKAHPEAKGSDQLAFKKADLLFGQKKYSEAIAEYRTFISRYRESSRVPDAYYWIGRSSLLLGQVDNALQAFNHVVNTYGSSPISENALLEIGMVYLARKNFAEAVSVFDRVEAKFPGRDPAIEAGYRKAIALQLGGDTAGAQQQFEVVAKKYPESVFAVKSRISLAQIHRTEGKTSDALAILNEVATSRTDELGAEAQYELGITRQLAVDYESAIAAFLRVKYVFPSASEWIARSYLRLGECYKATMQMGKAKDAYETVLKSHKNDDLGKEAEQKLRELEGS